MTKINTENWKEFRVGDLFTQERGKEKAPKQNKEGDCPLIQETNTDNGFCRMVKSTHVFPGNAITISINYATNVFYQPNPFCASVNIAILYNDNLNLQRGQFIASLLSSNNKKYNYTNKISKEKINDTFIALPVTPSGTPDWDYMDTYIENLKIKAENKIKKAKIVVAEPKKVINTDNWGDFKVGELFDSADRGSVSSFGKVSEGTVPVIAAAGSNNGIAGYYDVPALYSNKITVSCNGVGCGSTFYHEEAFNLNGDAVVLNENFNINKNIGLFIAAILNRLLTSKYSYEDKCNASKILNETVKLPTTPDGQPNWEYMENYIEELNRKIN